MSDFPTAGMAITHILVVSDVARSVDWYRDVLGAELFREYGGTSAVFSFEGAWLLLVTPGGPSPDKPATSFEVPSGTASVSHAMTIRVPDCWAAYETLRSRGATFMTPPIERPGETRCFFTDPDGHLFEISQA